MYLEHIVWFLSEFSLFAEEHIYIFPSKKSFVPKSHVLPQNKPRFTSLAVCIHIGCSSFPFQGEHSAALLTFIKLSVVIKIFVLSIPE